MLWSSLFISLNCCLLPPLLLLTDFFTVDPTVKIRSCCLLVTTNNELTCFYVTSHLSSPELQHFYWEEDWIDQLFLYCAISSIVLPTLPVGATRGWGYTGMMYGTVPTFTSGLANFLVRVEMVIRL